MQFSDQKIYELSRVLCGEFRTEQLQRRLDPNNLDELRKKEIKPLYPHKLNANRQIQKYGLCQACCDVNPGRFFCCDSTMPDTPFRKFGLGMCLYFKFLKHISAMLCLVSVASVLSCLICAWVCVSNGFNPIGDYNTFFFSTTLGVFSSERNKCTYAEIQSQQASVTLSCPYGTINTYGPVFSTQTTNSLYNCKNEILKYTTGSSLASPYILTQNTCSSGSSSCTITMTFNTFQTGTIVAYGYECLQNTYNLGAISIQSRILIYVVVSIDLFICLVFTLFFCSEAQAEDVETAFFKSQQLSLNDFSLQIKGFTSLNFDEQFNEFVGSLANELGNDFPQQIIQLKIPDSPKFIIYQRQKSDLYKKLYDLVDEYLFDRQIDPQKFSSAEQFYTNGFIAGQYPKYKEKLSILIKNYIQLKYQQEKQQNNKKISIYLVFASMKIKRRIKELQEEGCCGNFLKLQDKKYYLSEPPGPDLILWHNKEKWTFLRFIISWIITLAICFGSYLLFGYIQYEQKSLLSQYNFTIDCSILYQTSQLTTFDSTLDSSSSNYLNCFCKQNLFNFSNSDYYRCTSWRTQYITYLAIPLIISVGLVIYNVIVSTFFRLITSFQCHKLVTTELYSYTIKRSFLMVMNMALIMILLNINYDGSIGISQVSFLFTGNYTDITSDWYIQIGAIIILTMIFNITFPIVELVLGSLIKCFRKCWDKRCYTLPTSRKTKEQYIALFNEDIYPLEERYAYLISLIIICLAFNGVIPVLNIIVAISFTLLYFADKALVFKVYQTPLNYSGDLHKLVMKAIYFMLIAHMALTAVFLSEPNLVAPNSSVASTDAINSNNIRINLIIQTTYILPYAILFLLFVAWQFFDNTFLSLFRNCRESCQKHVSQIALYKLEQDFYESLNAFQMNRLKLLTQGEMHKFAVKRSRPASSRQGNTNTGMSIQMAGMNLPNETQVAIKNERQSQHEIILKRTFNRLKNEEQLRKRHDEKIQTYLIGLPGYQMLFGEKAFEQNKNNIILNEALERVLRSRQQFTTEVEKWKSNNKERPLTAEQKRAASRGGDLKVVQLVREDDVKLQEFTAKKQQIQ